MIKLKLCKTILYIFLFSQMEPFVKISIKNDNNKKKLQIKIKFNNLPKKRGLIFSFCSMNSGCLHDGQTELSG